MADNAPTSTVTTFTGINNKIDPQKLGLRGFVVADNIDIDGAARAVTRGGRTSINTTAYMSGFATADRMRAYAVTAAGVLEDWTSGSPVALTSGFVGYPYWAQIADTVFVGNENQCWRISADGRVEANALACPAPPTLKAVTGTLAAGQYRFIVVCVVHGRESAPSVEAIISVDGTQDILVSGIEGQRVYVCPADSQVFGRWCDTIANTLVYTGGAEQLDEELRTQNLRPMPLGRCIASYLGRLYCAVYDRRNDVSAIYRSVPLWWDVCDPVADMQLVPGEVRALAGVRDGLVIGTDRQIFSRDANDTLVEVAKYGVPPGQPITFDEKMPGEEAIECWLWTQRGLCKALPFAEVTPQFAAPTTDFVGSVVFRQHGDYRFVASVSLLGIPDNAT